MRKETVLGALVVVTVAALLWFTMLRPSGQAALAAAPASAAPGGEVSAGTAVGQPVRVEPAAPSARTSADMRAQTPAAQAARAASKSDLNGSELEQLQVEVPFGTLEILVLEGLEPLPGARVLVHGKIPGGPPPELDGLRSEYGLSGSTDGDGLVSFGGVNADTYSVRVLAPPRTIIETMVVHTLNVHRRVLVAYGTGTIYGHVYDDEGLPVRDCLVWVSAQYSQLVGQSIWARTTTDAQGAYEAGGLLASPVIWVERAGADGGQDQSVATSLDVGERKRIDFGYPGGAPRWTGTVRDSSGAAVEFPGQFTTLRRENNERGRFKSNADGTFDVPIQPGAYTINARGYEGSFGIGEVVVGTSGLRQDLTLPGTRLEVDVSYSGSYEDPDWVSGHIQVWLTRPGSPGRMSGAAAGNRRSFTAVPPGVYHLTTSPNPLMGGSPVTVTIRDSVPLERVSIAVSDP